MTTENNVQEVEQTENTLSVVERETADFVVLKENGKFVRKAKFKDFSSFTATTREDKMWLLNVLEGDGETGNGLKSHVGKVIEVEHIITRKYDRINEDTGMKEYGVLTYLITPEKVAYATSSKSVYFSITRIMDLFGTPNDPNWENIKIKVGKEKGLNGDMIKIKMVG